MTETNRQANTLWDSWPAARQQTHFDHHAAVAMRSSARLGARYGTPVEIVPADTQGSTVVYKARVGTFTKAFTMDTMAPTSDQRGLLELQISSLQAACELRTILDLHGIIDPEMKR